ncbi:ABC transporter substrate-binding protein [Geobacter pelophilus]|uniref:ABC transporter substrate-binding protein n=1 Tax=Geoanaerobacter pelophilus TaxID=60036 RepID=A0AAW4L1L5_9BACT|nr:ABC transporter substrate-binding protein [Geoanaerobacter pelophilus]MBT0664861.1 ABC transporter substrate-binding protein [Geoanaerobacter pelophilus]
MAQISRFAFIFLFILMVVGFPLEARAEKRIGVLLFSEEARYHEALKGIKDQLAKAGYKEPKVTFVMGNAGGSKAKAADMVKNYATGNISMMITLGTNATIAVAKEIKDVPIVFSMVYDPLEARVAKGWESSGTNVTGSSPKIPISELVGRLKEIRPVKRVAALYTPGEKNSESQLKELQSQQQKHGIKVIPVIIAKKEDVAQILPEVITSVDALYLSGSSVIGATIPPIVEIAAKAEVISFTHLEDLVKEGVLLGLCSDPYQLGVLAGKKAVAVMQGAKPSAIPIEAIAKPGVIINKKTVAASKVHIPKAFMQKVAKTY